MAQQWIKKKYTQPKTRGKYKSSSNDSGKRAVHRRKVTDRERAEIRARQPAVTLVLGPTGKRTFVREYPGR